MLKDKNIVFMLSGSIACFKAASLVSSLVKEDANVKCLMSPSATKFIGKATLEGLTGEKVIESDFIEGEVMSHINLVKWGDLFILCPATAIKINELAQGVGSGIINSLFLAFDFKSPFFIAPAMNTQMLNHPATQSSIKKLTSYGITVLGTGSGKLACKDEGKGRLLESEEILKVIKDHLS